jgi:putative effector of murein hydrolase
LGAYVVGLAVQRVAWRSALLNPTLLAIVVVATTLLLLKLDYGVYFTAAQPVHFLLGPAVVALAIPLYRHAALIRERAFDLLIGLACGSLSGVGSGIAAAWWLGVARPGILSIAPK